MRKAELTGIGILFPGKWLDVQNGFILRFQINDWFDNLKTSFNNIMPDINDTKSKNDICKLLRSSKRYDTLISYSIHRF